MSSGMLNGTGVVNSTGNRESQGPGQDGSVIGTPERVVASNIEMPRAPVDIGSLGTCDEGFTVHTESPRQANTFGLRQIDHSDLFRYPTLRTVLERLGEIADHIREDTGLKLDLSRVSFDVCRSDEYALRALKESLLRVGIAPETIDGVSDKDHPDHRGLHKSLESIRLYTLGVFLPTEGAVLLNGGLINKGNANHLAMVLYHELIHAAQHQNFPGFFETAASYGKLAAELLQRGLKNSPEYINALDSKDACLQLLEGMPTSLQMANRKAYFPGASAGFGFLDTVKSVAHALLTRKGWSDMVKYIAGAQKYAAFQKLSPHIDHLAYQVPELALIAGKKQGSVVLTFPDILTTDQRKLVVDVVKMFAGLDKLSKLQCSIKFSPGGKESEVRLIDPTPILSRYAELRAASDTFSRTGKAAKT